MNAVEAQLLLCEDSRVRVCARMVVSQSALCAGCRFEVGND